MERPLPVWAKDRKIVVSSGVHIKIRWRGLIASFAIAGAAIGIPLTSLSGENDSDQLSNSLSEMGYVQVEVSGCTVSFSREGPPNEENNGFYKYSRTIHLGNLNLIEMSPVSQVQLDDRTIYQILAPLSSEYSELFRQTFFFRTWVRKKYPGVYWPYEHPKFHDAFSPLVEAELQNWFTQIEKMNIRIDYANFGPVTVMPVQFDMTFGSFEPLAYFREALLDQAVEYECGQI